MKENPAKKKKRYAWNIFVPRCSNDGVEFTVQFHRIWDKMVRNISGGITIFKPAIGHWVNPEGQVFVEEMIPVRVVCTEAEIEIIMDLTMEHYKQEAVYAELASTKVKIRHRD